MKPTPPTPARKAGTHQSPSRPTKAREADPGPRSAPTPLGEPTSSPWICKASQVRALASPVRQEIVDALESAGPRTMAELAGLLGRRADALYFHVRHLLAVGLVVEREPRVDGRHVASVYDVAWRPMRLSYRPPARAKDIRAVVSGATRLALRDFGEALASVPHLEQEPDRGRPDNLWGARAKGWLTKEQLAELNGLLERALQMLRDSPPREDAACVSVCFVLAPARQAGPSTATRPRRGVGARPPAPGAKPANHKPGGSP
ncbi:MAG: helix-turn-helix domain-containing protein [Planctomycetota bacterium]|nr:helix-turn-helix domain-containing protein [Planctomycetota bacterium]